MDTIPLQPPSTWIHPRDIAQWTDPQTNATYGYAVPSKSHPDADPQQDRPVNLVVGLEADTDPASDAYWRMGYEYPVQLTQWALASAPKHPVLSRFMADLAAQVGEVADQVRLRRPRNVTEALRAQMARLDPLTLTGPAAVTLATMGWLQEEVGLRWEAVSGLADGGQAKLVRDVLVLPITAFRYVIPLFLHPRFLLGCLLTRIWIAPGVESTETWARNPSMTQTRVWLIERKGRGGSLTLRWSWASSAVRCLACVRTGPRSLGERCCLSLGVALEILVFMICNYCFLSCPLYGSRYI